jgi:hypothetical protein
MCGRFSRLADWKGGRRRIYIVDTFCNFGYSVDTA